MKPFLYIRANVIAGIVLVLLLLDPTRPLAPVVILICLAVICTAVPRFIRR
jgi:hypothetical protein